MTAAGSSSARSSFLKNIEPLWVACLGALIVVVARLAIPVLIHMIGRGGATETIEWAVYMTLLLVYAPLVLAHVIVRGRNPTMLQFLVIAVALIGAAAAALRLHPVAVIAAIVVAAATAHVFVERRTRASLLALTVVGTFSWIAVTGFISWASPPQWLFRSAVSILVGAAAVALAVFALRTTAVEASARRITVLDVAFLVVLVAFSFRTFPVVEFYHWGFYVGPIEELRQGGRLLWDTPSQYGFLSILLPALLPASSWISFWVYQSLIFAIVAVMMYVAIRGVTDNHIGAVFAFVVAFTTLFFRPRETNLLLSAQMTPSGGPVRFLWSFVLLAYIYRFVRRSNTERDNQTFVVVGTIIWLCSILWSAEGAIYCTAIWGMSLIVFALQRAANLSDLRARVIEIARVFVTPVVGLAITVAIVIAVYWAIVGRFPDFTGYIEYVLLYSRGGFGALPIDPTGAVWYLLLLFFIASTAAAMQLMLDWRSPRVIAFAAIWACMWSVGSYFVGRSHPVNALSLVPLLLFALTLLLGLLKTGNRESWHRLIVTASVPAFAMPVIMTAAHGKLIEQITTPQLPPKDFKAQLPVMDSSLYSLLQFANARPADSYVLIGDGRLMLPAWPTGDHVTSDRSWLPKPYEIIGSLPAQRRQTYIDRNTERFPETGWLIHSKRDTIRDFSEHLAQIERRRSEVARYENDRWIVVPMAVKH